MKHTNHVIYPTRANKLKYEEVLGLLMAGRKTEKGEYFISSGQNKMYFILHAFYLSIIQINTRKWG
jgi:hypothetical protein